MKLLHSTQKGRKQKESYIDLSWHDTTFFLFLKFHSEKLQTEGIVHWFVITLHCFIPHWTVGNCIPLPNLKVEIKRYWYHTILLDTENVGGKWLLHLTLTLTDWKLTCSPQKTWNWRKLYTQEEVPEAEWIAHNHNSHTRWCHKNRRKEKWVLTFPTVMYYSYVSVHLYYIYTFLEEKCSLPSCSLPSHWPSMRQKLADWQQWVGQQICLKFATV